MKKRIVTDNCIVLGKNYVEAKQEREIKDFKTGETTTIPASDEKYQVTVASAQTIDCDFGMEDVQLATYNIDKDLFSSINPFDRGELDFEWNGTSTKFVALRILKQKTKEEKV